MLKRAVITLSEMGFISSTAVSDLFVINKKLNSIFMCVILFGVSGLYNCVDSGVVFWLHAVVYAFVIFFFVDTNICILILFKCTKTLPSISRIQIKIFILKSNHFYYILFLF